MTKLIVASRKFANGPKILHYRSLRPITKCHIVTGIMTFQDTVRYPFPINHVRAYSHICQTLLSRNYVLRCLELYTQHGGSYFEQ
jgi:hypothetical protein